MAGSGRRMVWFCCVVLLLVVVDGAVAFERRVDWDQARVVGSTQELYLRGNTVTTPESVSTEAVKSYDTFDEFQRRELEDSGYSTNPADPNCDNDPTLCDP
ncbi:hypothetical protein M758_6G038200 [Ceratodon purpureus]|nr:hypothetical protein M758_6G038200 [Ceratodon purpureus]